MKADPKPIQFLAPPAELSLLAGEVHLWSAALDCAPANASQLLSASEWARAARFHFERDRAQYIAARALVRSILARYAGREPQELSFSFGPHGKPELADSMLRFNLSHSGNLLLLAVTFGRELGVDLEQMRDGVSCEMLADHYFTPQESWDLRQIDKSKRAAGFYEIWTRTEARLKASGVGLANGTAVADASRWNVVSFRPADGYFAALASEGSSVHLQCWEWRNEDAVENNPLPNPALAAGSLAPLSPTVLSDLHAEPQKIAAG